MNTMEIINKKLTTTSILSATVRKFSPCVLLYAPKHEIKFKYSKVSKKIISHNFIVGFFIIILRSYGREIYHCCFVKHPSESDKHICNVLHVVNFRDRIGFFQQIISKTAIVALAFFAPSRNHKYSNLLVLYTASPASSHISVVRTLSIHLRSWIRD